MILDAEQLAAIRRLNRAAKKHYGEDSAQRWAFVAECLPSIHPDYALPTGTRTGTCAGSPDT